MNLVEQVKQAVDGELWVKPYGPDGTPLSDPYSIFRSPDEVRVFGTAHASKLGNFAEADSHVFLGSNLVVDLGRQSLAYLVGGKDYTADAAIDNWIITKASWGTYDEVPRFSDATLSPQAGPGITAGANEIEYSAGLKKKQIFSVDWPTPFIVRFEAVLNADEGNGYLIREMGLWTGNDTLFARKVFPAIEKNDTFSLGFLWRIRF
jgi:hypothetical protein